MYLKEGTLYQTFKDINTEKVKNKYGFDPTQKEKLFRSTTEN